MASGTIRKKIPLLYIQKMISTVTIPSDGYADITSYKPTAPTNYTLLISEFRSWGAIQNGTGALNIAGDGRYVLGPVGATIKNLVVWYIYVSNDYINLTE